MLRRVSITVVVLIGLSAQPAWAEAWEVKAGLGPVFGTELSTQRKDGLGVQAYLDVGLTDLFSLSVGCGYAHHFIGGGQGYDLVNATAGITLNLDVVLFGVGLALVPYLSTRLGVVQQRFDDQPATAGLGGSLALGLDYLWREEYTVGLAFEYHGMLSDVESFPAYLGITARVGFRWLD